VSAPPTGTAERERRLQWLALWRLLVGTLILGISLWLHLDAGVALDGFTPTALTALIVVTFSTTAVALGGRLAGWPFGGRAWLSIAADLVVATGLVYVSGGAASAFSILYGASILGAAITIGVRGAVVATAASLVLYALIALGVSSSWLPVPPDQNPAAYALELRELAFSMLSNVVGLVAVGGLSLVLASRLEQERGAAVAAEAARARLSQLNDDIVRSLGSGLVTLGADDRVTFINEAGLALLDRTEADILGQPIEAVLGFAPAMDGRAEGRSTTADGRALVLGYSRTPLVGEAGRSLLLFQDLTEITELREAAKRADQLAVLGRLAAGLAHEIRNPLGSIQGSVQLVRDSGDLDPEDASLLDLVRGEVQRLNDLVVTMLAVGRPTAPRPRQADLAQVVRATVQLIESDADLTEGRPVDVIGPASIAAVFDPDAMKQVVWNLVKNALQASPAQGQVRVRVREESDQVLLEVEDEGEGVPEEEREKLFDMFFTKRARGIGLGLALVHQIVEAHWGTIAVTQGESGGALFRVTLPRGRLQPPTSSETMMSMDAPAGPA